MALNYSVQPDEITLFDGVTLTSAYSGNASVVIDCAGMSAITLLATYTTGSGETSNTMEIKLETVDDDSAVYQWTNVQVGADETVTKQSEYTIEDNAAAATTKRYRIGINDINEKKIKFSVKETGVSSNYGTCSLKLIMGGQ